ncbi:MAG: 50S ribosomal protein L3 N(5)-glutamine methyltransferase [Saezia sp.]
MRIIDYIEEACERFEQAGISFGQGTTNAFDEAAWLVLWKLGLPVDDLEGVAEQEIEGFEAIEVLNALIQQRITTRKPAAYLMHEAWLHGVPFYVDERSIVPRSLISEGLVEGDLDMWLERAVLARDDTAPHILDLCTGNGSLAILAAMAWPDAVVTGSDISADALAVARMNVEKHQLGERVTLIEGDGLKHPEIEKHMPFDLILCNPPYVNAQSMAALPDEFRAEPALALAGGEDGMDFVRDLLIHAANYLSPQGVLVLEIGHEREHFEAAFPMLEALWLSTSAGEDQVLLLTNEALLAHKK